MPIRPTARDSNHIPDSARCNDDERHNVSVVPSAASWFDLDEVRAKVVHPSSIDRVPGGGSAKQLWLWATSIGILTLFVVAIGFSFLTPEVLLTDAARGLSGARRADAENAVRTSIIQVGGSIIVIGALGLAAWRLMLTDRQLGSMEASAQASADSARAALENVQHQREPTRREEQVRWEDKLRDAYADWAAALFYAAVANCDIGDANKKGDAEKKRRAREAFDSNHFRTETIMLRILMMEKRPSLLSALKEINAQKMPDGPFAPKLRAMFWDNLHQDAHLYRDAVGAFLGLLRQRLERFSDVVTDPTLEDFSLPNGDNYRAYVVNEFKKRNLHWQEGWALRAIVRVGPLALFGSSARSRSSRSLAVHWPKVVSGLAWLHPACCGAGGRAAVPGMPFARNDAVRVPPQAISGRYKV